MSTADKMSQVTQDAVIKQRGKKEWCLLTLHRPQAVALILFVRVDR